MLSLITNSLSNKGETLKLSELHEELSAIFPGYGIGWDNDGQLVIYTGLYRNSDGEHVYHIG